MRPGALEPDLTSQLALDMYRNMIRLEAMDDIFYNAQRQVWEAQPLASRFRARRSFHDRLPPRPHGFSSTNGRRRDDDRPFKPPQVLMLNACATPHGNIWREDPGGWVRYAVGRPQPWTAKARGTTNPSYTPLNSSVAARGAKRARAEHRRSNGTAPALGQGRKPGRDEISAPVLRRDRNATATTASRGSMPGTDVVLHAVGRGGGPAVRRGRSPGPRRHHVHAVQGAGDPHVARLRAPGESQARRRSSIRCRPCEVSSANRGMSTPSRLRSSRQGRWGGRASLPALSALSVVLGDRRVTHRACTEVDRVMSDDRGRGSVRGRGEAVRPLAYSAGLAWG